ncbi:hypothetical protein Tco_0691052 [Tanacetum coccineum]
MLLSKRLANASKKGFHDLFMMRRVREDLRNLLRQGIIIDGRRGSTNSRNAFHYPHSHHRLLDERMSRNQWAITGLIYHDLYLDGKALVEKENVGFDLTKSDLYPSFVKYLTVKGVGLRMADSHTGGVPANQLGSVSNYCALYVFRRRPTAKGVGLRVADSHTGNHPEDGFTPLETIRRLLVVIGRRSYSGFEGDAFEPERRAQNDFATATFPWLDEFVADATALIGALLSKKSPTSHGVSVNLCPKGGVLPVERLYFDQASAFKLIYLWHVQCDAIMVEIPPFGRLSFVLPLGAQVLGGLRSAPLCTFIGEASCVALSLMGFNFEGSCVALSCGDKCIVLLQKRR